MNPVYDEMAPMCRASCIFQTANVFWMQKRLRYGCLFTLSALLAQILYPEFARVGPFLFFHCDNFRQPI